MLEPEILMMLGSINKALQDIAASLKVLAQPPNKPEPEAIEEKK